MTEVVFVLARGQNAFFFEIAEALRFELQNLGVSSSLHEGELPEPGPGIVPVLLPPHEYARLAPRRIRPRELKGAICICAEQPSSAWFGANVRYVHSAAAVFDLSTRGVAALRRIGVRADHLQLGYTRRWDRFSPSPRDIDLAFLGSSTSRRDRLLASYAPYLCQHRVELVISDNRRPNPRTNASFLAGDDKLRLLARSKLLLNLHRERDPHFEWPRALEAVHCGALLLSERSSDYGPLLPGEHLLAGRSEVLPELAEAMLDDVAARDRLAADAYEFVRAELPMQAAAERLAEAAEQVSRRRPKRSAGFRGAGPRSSGPRRTLAERVAPLIELGATPITRLGKQVKEIRLELDSVSRKLDELTYTLEHDGPPVPEVALDTRSEGDDPRVTVVITLYNYGHVVATCLDSVARTGFEDLEVVVVDDGSTDGSSALVRAWIGDSGIPGALIRHPVNRGLPAARNSGAKQARGDYILMLDADNQLYPQSIARLVEALDADPGAGFAYGILERFDRTGPIGLKNKFGWDLERLRRGNYIDALALIRGHVLEELGGYTTDLRLFGWEDYDLWCAIASLGLRGAHVREIVGRYRISPESMTGIIDLSLDVARSVIAERHPVVFAGSTPKSSTIDQITEHLA